MKMKVFIILCFTVALVYGQPGPEGRRRGECQQIATSLYYGMQETLRRIPAMTIAYQRYLGISGRNQGELTQLVCSVFGAKTLREIADKIPATYDQVREFWGSIRQHAISRGGYTGMWRYPAIRFEVGKWAKSNGFTVSDTNISKHVDQETFSNFLEIMQVKYGARWISALIDEPNEAVLVTDIGKFATDLYESKTANELSARTGLDRGKCNILLQVFGWQTKDPEKFWGAEQRNFRIMELLGRNGFLNLQ